MSLVQTMYLIEKYGLRLNVEQLADALDSTVNSIHRRISDKTLGIDTYIDAGKRYADVRDVAEYLDRKRAEVKARSAMIPA